MPQRKVRVAAAGKLRRERKKSKLIKWWGKMFPKAFILHSRTDEENSDSGAETAGSVCSKMSSSSSSPAQDLPPVTVHLLANPGDSLLLQHTLDRLLKWVCPGLRLFHVSERPCPVRNDEDEDGDGNARSHPPPVAGQPSLSVTLFLHEAYGEERILRVLDFLQRPPWRYHHTEGGRGGRTGGFRGGGYSSADSRLRPYLLPSRDFYSLGAGMPVWGVRPVHSGRGGEAVRLTLHSSYDDFEDAVRLYETVLQRRAEEQKPGFCWFTLQDDGGLALQLALKRLAPGVRADPCHSAVLQFGVGEVGQLVPLLPNPCSPISATRWQSEDLDGNKILFQVKASSQPPRLFTSAFPITPSSALTPRTLLRCPVPTRLRSASPPGFHGVRIPQLKERGLVRSRSDSLAPQRLGFGGESLGSGSDCSTPPGSSCYSSQRSSPAALCTNPSEPTSAHSGPADARVVLGEEPETNVDTGCAVTPRIQGVPVLDTLAGDLKRCLPHVCGESDAQTCVQEVDHVDEFFI